MTAAPQQPKIDAVQAYFQRLLAANGGVITRQAVTDYNKNPEALFHNRYNWNVEEAANEHWNHVSGQLIRQYQELITVFTYQGEERDLERVSVPVLHNTILDGERVYAAIDRICADDDAYEFTLNAALKRLRGAALDALNILSRKDGNKAMVRLISRIVKMID